MTASTPVRPNRVTRKRNPALPRLALLLLALTAAAFGVIKIAAAMHVSRTLAPELSGPALAIVNALSQLFALAMLLAVGLYVDKLCRGRRAKASGRRPDSSPRAPRAPKPLPVPPAAIPAAPPPPLASTTPARIEQAASPFA